MRKYKKSYEKEEKMERFRRLPKATVLLVGLNVIWFLVLTMQGGSTDTSVAVTHGALYAPLVFEGGEYYRLLSSLFVHFGFEHMFFNMVLLCFLGNILERELGSLVYLFSYLAAGLCGNIASLVYYASSSRYVVSAGASGAIFGLVGMVAYMVYVNRGYFRGISSRQILLMVVFSLYSGITEGGVNNIAHVAGLVSGLLCGMAFYRSRY